MSRPFDEARYRGLLEGLEITIADFGDIQLGDRSDAEYYSKENLAIEQELIHHDAKRLDKYCTVVASAFYPAAAELYESGDVPFARCVDCVSFPVISTMQGELFEQIPRWFLEESGQIHKVGRGDIIITKVGTPCFASVVHDFDEVALSRTVLGLTKIQGIDPYYLTAFLRSRYGFGQLMRQRELTIQYQLTLERVRDVLIFDPSPKLQKKIAQVMRGYVDTLQNAATKRTSAEQTLLHALGLENWQPPEPLTYTRPSRDAFAAGRLDPEHFKPKYAGLETHIRATGCFSQLEDLLAINERGTQPDYAESGLAVVNSKHVADGEVRLNDDNRLAIAGSNALKIKQGDVLMNGTGVGTIGRAAPFLHDTEALPDNHVTVLRPKVGRIDSVYLSVYLNSLAGQFQVNKWLRGSSGQIELYPNDIAQFLVWIAPTEVQQSIRKAIDDAFAAKRNATRLLDAAKCAVELAIESGEESALGFLNREITPQ